MAKPYRILSIDGGGIRGIIPTILLAEFEKRTGKPASELFDMTAGTSTGGIIALALNMPDEEGHPKYTAGDLVRLYEQNGERIFSRPLWHAISSVANLAEVKYTSEGIEEVFSNYFGTVRLSEALNEVLVTSYDIERQEPFLFKRHIARSDPDADFLMKQVARATSAAPTYFEPYKLESDELAGYYALVDGLVFASNPALCAFVESGLLQPDREDFLLVSLGTGRSTHRRLYEEVRSWGTLRWGQQLLNTVLHGVSLCVHYQMKKLLPPIKEVPRYWRFQSKIEREREPMDDVRPENLRALKLLAEDLIRERDEDINKLCELLTG